MVYWTLDVSYSWTWNSAGGMKGVTYAGGETYGTSTLCPANVNLGYACDGRNTDAGTNLDAGTVEAFCNGHVGTSKQWAFGHAVQDKQSQSCGQCAQIRVARTSGGYNYMTVMMVDAWTDSMEVGTTAMGYLLEGVDGKALGDRLDFEYQIVGNYDCYAAFEDSGTVPTTSTTKPPTSSGTAPTNASPTKSESTSGTCSVSGNWGLYICIIYCFVYK